MRLIKYKQYNGGFEVIIKTAVFFIQNENTERIKFTLI